jgi:hypothetical protein
MANSRVRWYLGVRDPIGTTSMSEDRESERASAPDEPKREAGNAVPFVSPDDTANMVAIRAAQRRRAAAALFQDSTAFPHIVQGAAGTAAGAGAANAVGEAVVAGTGTAMSSGRATLTLTPDWAVLRSELITRLDAIEEGLRAFALIIEKFETAYRESARIGHNNPPEDIDLLPIGLAELELGIVAATLARTEVNLDYPRPDVLRFCGLVLRWGGGLLSACIKWIGAKGDVFVDSTLKSIGKTVGPATAAVLVAKLSGINIELNEVVNKLRYLVVEVMHLPF